jgi:NTE family protein
MTKPIALVIGSGSVKCAAAIGLQNVLHREGFDLNLLVGCSGGSLYAALMALGYDAPTMTEITRRLWTSEITRPRSYRDFFSILLPGLLKFNERFGLLDDRLAMSRLRAAYGERTFADVKIPLHIVATDFLNGEQVTLSEGKLADAIRASIAMPYIFKPYRVAERLLVDGYLSDPMPVGVAIKQGADVILAMGFESPFQTRMNSLMRFSFQVSSIMSNNLLRANFAFHNLAHHSEIIPIVPQFTRRIGLFDTDKIPYIIEEGERAAEAQIPYLRRLLKGDG